MGLDCHWYSDTHRRVSHAYPVKAPERLRVSLWPRLALNVQEIKGTSAQVRKLASGVWEKRCPFRRGLFFKSKLDPSLPAPHTTHSVPADQLRSLKLNDITARSTSQGEGVGRETPTWSRCNGMAPPSPWAPSSTSLIPGLETLQVGEPDIFISK